MKKVLFFVFLLFSINIAFGALNFGGDIKVNTGLIGSDTLPTYVNTKLRDSDNLPTEINNKITSSGIINYYYGPIIIGVLIFIINFFIFAWILKLVVNNYRKSLEYKRSLLYSLIFIIFSIIGFSIGSIFIKNSFLVYIVGSFLGGIALYIFGRNIFKDDFTNLGLIIRVILANFLILSILSLILTFVVGIIIKS